MVLYYVHSALCTRHFQDFCRGRAHLRMEEVLYLQPMVPPKRFDIFSRCLGDAQKV